MATSITGSSSQWGPTNSDSNTSTVYGYGKITMTNGNFYGLQAYGTVTIDGVTSDAIAGPTSMSVGDTWEWSWSRGFNHDGNGYRGDKSVSINFWVAGTSYHANSKTLDTQGAIDWNRYAKTPNAPSLSRTSNGTSISMSTNNPGAWYGNEVDYYHWYYSTDGTNFSYLAQSNLNAQKTGTSYNWTGVSSTTPVWIRVYAHAPEPSGGWSSYSGSTYVAAVPNAPAAPTLVRSTNNGSTIVASWSAPGNNGSSITNYRISIREGLNGTWSQYTTTSTNYTFNSLTNTSTYYFYVEAYNAYGWSSGSAQSSVVGVPTQPSSITVPTPVGLKTTVSWGTSSNGTISNYYVSASSDNGVTWQTEIAKGTLTSHEFTNLEGGKFYKFRVRAQNEIGTSTYVTSASVFNSAGGKRWTGLAWEATATAKRWDGTAWTAFSIAKRWDGTNWINLS